MVTSSSCDLNAVTRGRLISAAYWVSCHQSRALAKRYEEKGMTDVDHYIRAATRDNTRLSYRAAVEHFESQWGGFLPATSDSVARYLVDYANTLSVNTLRQRLAGLAAWHLDQGFPDPTKAPHVKKVLKGIAELHPVVQKQAKPIQLDQLSL